MKKKTRNLIEIDDLCVDETHSRDMKKQTRDQCFIVERFKCVRQRFISKIIT